MAHKQESWLRSLLSSISVHFFDKWRTKSIGFGLIFIFGLFSYMTFLPREGFPPIQFPLTLVNGVYFVDDAEVVDADVVQPALEAIDGIDGVSETQSNAAANNFSLFIFFDEDVNPAEATQEINETLGEVSVPAGVEFNVTSINPAAYLNEYDLLLAVGGPNNVQSTAELQATAEFVAEEFNKDNRITGAEVVELVQESIDPRTGQAVERQTNFNFFAGDDEPNSSNTVNFYEAVTVGITKSDDIDFIDLSNVVREIADRVENEETLTSTNTQIAIGADFASAIETQISSLQSNLFSGIFAVALVSWALITWRASLITAVFMIGVMLVTMIVLLAVGYTLNTITLFALVLALGLFVDDATIVIEAIVAARAKGKKAREAVKQAVVKVAPASIAGTLTTVLVFLPLAFVTGILGEFIRLLPITVIISLLVSLFLSLTLIPLLSRFGLKSMNTESSAKSRAIEAVADKMSGLVLLLQTKPQVGRLIGVGMVLLSLGIVMATGSFAQKVEFNIFPPSDDSDQISVNYEFAPGTTLEEARDVSAEANQVISETLGENLVRALYGGFVPSSERGADVVIELVPFTQREITSQEFIEKLQEPLSDVVGEVASVKLTQIDAGPPVEELPFKVQVIGENQQETLGLAQEIEDYLSGLTVERQTGTTSKITATDISYSNTVARKDGQRFVEVAAGFADDDISALVVAAQEKLEAEFTQDKLDEYGANISLGFDFGQESDSAESFAALGVVFPIAILAILVLLALQFRSIIQPLLIILAIPFSIFGVFFGLYITNNALSFFSSVGMIGLIGIAVNNTILLTDYANQERSKGKNRVEAIASALKQRFRPLVATTLTTIVALLPLALNDPFWEPLAYTIIFGLASSTLLVILSFPYYYIMAEAGSTSVKNGFKKLFKK